MNELTSIFDLTKLNAFDKTGKIIENCYNLFHFIHGQGFLLSTYFIINTYARHYRLI